MGITVNDTIQKLKDVIEHVLIASEDGGDMNDIDWNLLREAMELTVEKEMTDES